MLKLAILYRTTTGSWGGGNSFLRSLRATWENQGIVVIDHLEPGLHGVLINSSQMGASGRTTMLTPERAARLVQTGYLNPIPPLLHYSRWRKEGHRPPFVHRLDGVFRLYGRPAGDPTDVAQVGINRVMDWTVYQSEFCRQSFQAEGLDVSRSTVIFNGVDTDRFFPASSLPSISTFRLVMVSWSPNLKKGAAYAVRAAEVAGVEVTFIGQWPPSLASGKVRVLPPQTHDVLPEMLRQHHAMLHMAFNDPCSNAILEGMASGLPVIYHPSGGSPEIVGDAGVPGEPDLEAAIEQVRDRYSELRERVLGRRSAISITSAAGAYRQMFESLKPQPL